LTAKRVQGRHIPMLKSGSALLLSLSSPIF
jgi:hypothetical protein